MIEHGCEWYSQQSIIPPNWSENEWPTAKFKVEVYSGIYHTTANSTNPSRNTGHQASQPLTGMAMGVVGKLATPSAIVGMQVEKCGID